jgi:hypothetical protein
MSRDFFLLNRCFQVCKICREQASSGFTLPPPQTRAKLPTKLNEFYALLDRLCSIADGSDSMAPSSAHDARVEVNEDQRRDMETFEKTIVANRFSADERVKQPAVALIRAIFADVNYFSGLKPLPQYTDAFAYELLFPSWLNLLNAAMLPRADNGKPRLEGARQGAMFEFLGAIETLDENQQRLVVGFMTFIASRFDAPQCEDLLQRLVDLVGQQGATIVEALDGIDLACKDARELRPAIVDYLVVETSLLLRDTHSSYSIAYQRPTRRPIAEIIASALKQRAETQLWPQFLYIARPLRLLLESNHALVPTFIPVLTLRPDRIGDLLNLVASQPSSGRILVLASAGQEVMAALATAQPDLLQEQFACLQRFARDIAPNLHGFSEEALKYFTRVLISDEGGRKLLLESLRNDTARVALLEQLLLRAGKTDDHSRALSLLCCASLLWGQPEASEARASLHAIESVVNNRTIGTRELSDLLADLQAHPLQALEYLASPMMAAAAKSPRVAALYLTLNEVSQKLGANGTVDNFSVVRAKYSKLTNLDLGTSQ